MQHHESRGAVALSSSHRHESIYSSKQSADEELYFYHEQAFFKAQLLHFRKIFFTFVGYSP